MGRTELVEGEAPAEAEAAAGDESAGEAESSDE